MLHGVNCLKAFLFVCSFRSEWKPGSWRCCQPEVRYTKVGTSRCEDARFRGDLVQGWGHWGHLWSVAFSQGASWSLLDQARPQPLEVQVFSPLPLSIVSIQFSTAPPSAKSLAHWKHPRSANRALMRSDACGEKRFLSGKGTCPSGICVNCVRARLRIFVCVRTPHRPFY